jgi:hypothetical protein
MAVALTTAQQRKLVASATHLRSVLAAKRRDPLAHWRFAVPRLKLAFAMFSYHRKPIDELLLRACNKGTKSESLAAFVVACCQKRGTLDGVQLPEWVGPVEATQLVLDYTQQLLSVQPAYLRVLGSWPHRAVYDREVLKTLWIKPLGGSDDESTWSVIHFLSQENRKSGTGVRGDIVAFDEPPNMEILRELRKAAHAGRRGIIIVGMTPTKRRQWAPIREDYGDGPRRTLRRVDEERAECRWSLDEVEDWLISPSEKAKLRRKYKTDPLADAREHGDYSNTEGKCPLDAEMLVQMLPDCYDPQIVQWRVTCEDEQGKPSLVLTVPVEVYVPARKGMKGYIAIDPASGIDDSAHHPAALHVSEIGTGNLLARWKGYLPPYSLGVLAAGLARQYGDAKIDIEMKDHWGANVVRGVEKSRAGGLLLMETRTLKPNAPPSWEIGWDMNEGARNEIIGAIQEWLANRRAGIKYADCPSRAVIEALLDLELDDRDKIVAGEGIEHAEDMVVWGQKLRRKGVIHRSNAVIPEMYKPERHPDASLVDLIRGADPEEDTGPGGQTYSRRLEAPTT